MKNGIARRDEPLCQHLLVSGFFVLGYGLHYYGKYPCFTLEGEVSLLFCGN
jgi:hypothetical protein